MKVAALILAHVVEMDVADRDISAVKTTVAALCQPYAAQEYVAFKDTAAAMAGAAGIPRDVANLLIPALMLLWCSHLPSPLS
ncbi:hypothetical protein TNCV_2478321 [Trichonephila clavipes]|nr:hypothetical protein TNCV_2478321 [Trichonephila clavipes]